MAKPRVGGRGTGGVVHCGPHWKSLPQPLIPCSPADSVAFQKDLSSKKKNQSNLKERTGLWLYEVHVVLLWPACCEQLGSVPSFLRGRLTVTLQVVARSRRQRALASGC